MNANRVVIVGGGFGGLAAAKVLTRHPVEVTLVDRTNHHLFQPLLYQVATGGLSPGNIAQPIRSILKKAGRVTVVLDEARGIDFQSRELLSARRAYPFDYLLLATGARHSYFGHPEWESFAPGLKSVDDALEIRRRILTAFEIAERSTDPAEKAEAMTFVVVGGGPTGVELAGAISELARFTLRRDFLHINPADARILLIDAGPRVLQSFPEELSRKAERALQKLHVEVRCGIAVRVVSDRHVELDGTIIPTRTVLWAAGNEASPLGRVLGAPLDRMGRVRVNADLSVPGHPEVFVVGDLANFSHGTGHALPGISPVAIQEGRHAAENILAAIKCLPTRPFRYRDRGTMATIGRNLAVADLKFARFNGRLAWLAWLFVHLIFLIGFQNKLQVFLLWVWAYLTYKRGARLITGRPA